MQTKEEGAVTYDIADLILICLLLFCFWYWNNAQQVKEIAHHAVKRYCLKLDLQMLDDYVALNAFWLKRNDQGKLQLWRSFVFEFTSTGEDRYNGRIIMLGRVIEAIQLEPYRF